MILVLENLLGNCITIPSTSASDIMLASLRTLSYAAICILYPELIEAKADSIETEIIGASMAEFFVLTSFLICMYKPVTYTDIYILCTT
jgi:hypothetical protein